MAAGADFDAKKSAIPTPPGPRTRRPDRGEFIEVETDASPQATANPASPKQLMRLPSSRSPGVPASKKETQYEAVSQILPKPQLTKEEIVNKGKAIRDIAELQEKEVIKDALEKYSGIPVKERSGIASCLTEIDHAADLFSQGKYSEASSALNDLYDRNPEIKAYKERHPNVVRYILARYGVSNWELPKGSDLPHNIGKAF